MLLLRVCRIINGATKWVVSATIGICVLYYCHDVRAWYCLTGAIGNAFFSRGLKFIINEKRPVGARKKDPGMPSSHAQSLYYFATYATLLLYDSGSMIGIGCVQALGLILASLRVTLGYHTMPQVLVGALAGSLFSVASIFFISIPLIVIRSTLFQAKMKFWLSLSTNVESLLWKINTTLLQWEHIL